MATTKRNVFKIGFKDETYATLLHRLGGRSMVDLVSDVTLRKFGNTVCYRYHNTDIVVFAEDGVIALFTGGWYTPSTKNCINAILDGIATIEQQKGVWSVYYNGKRYAFASGMTINTLDKTVSTHELPLPVPVRQKPIEAV